MIAQKIKDKCEKATLSMRQNILKLALNAENNGAHIAPALSIVEIMSVLYLNIMKINKENLYSDENDRFILSKGHGALGYYTALFEAHIITKEKLLTYEKNGGDLPGQPCKNENIGIDFSGGSLGLGLAYGAGLALAARQKKNDCKIYVLMGDGEINEGSVWESVMFASMYHLTNLIIIIDRNGMQSDGFTKDIMILDIPKILESFGWQVVQCDGHDISQLMEAFKTPIQDKPLAIIAETVKGKGIRFMENNKDWHHSRLTQKQYETGLSELQVGEVSENDGL